MIDTDDLYRYAIQLKAYGDAWGAAKVKQAADEIEQLRKRAVYVPVPRCDTPGCINAAIEISVGEGYCEGARFRCAKHKEAK